MKKQFMRGTLAVSLLLLLTGCGATFNKALGIPNSPQEFIADQEDREMAGAYADLYNSNIYSMRSLKSGFKLENVLVSFDDTHVSRSSAANHINSMSLDDDEIAKRFKETVAKRGNIYTVYKNLINQKAFEALVGGQLARVDTNKHLYYDWTPAIFEYDNSGRIQSVLIRKISVTPHPMGKNDPMAPVKIELSSSIYFGGTAYKIQNRMNNRTLSEYELYTSTVNRSKSALVVPVSQTAELKELYELHTSGALTKEEYEVQKAKLLDKTNNIAPQPVKEKKGFSLQNALVQDYNRKHGTNYSSMKEIFAAKKLGM